MINKMRFRNVLLLSLSFSLVFHFVVLLQYADNHVNSKVVNAWQSPVVLLTFLGIYLTFRFRYKNIYVLIASIITLVVGFIVLELYISFIMDRFTFNDYGGTVGMHCSFYDPIKHYCISYIMDEDAYTVYNYISYMFDYILSTFTQILVLMPFIYITNPNKWKN